MEKESFSDFGSAKIEVHTRANRDGINWGLWRGTTGNYYPISSHDPKIKWIGVIYWALPDRIDAQLTAKQVEILRQNGAW